MTNLSYTNIDVNEEYIYSYTENFRGSYEYDHTK